MSAAAVENSMADALEWAAKGDSLLARDFEKKAQKAAAEAGLPRPSLSTDTIKQMWTVTTENSMADALEWAAKGDSLLARDFEKKAQKAAAEAGLPRPSLSTDNIK